MLPATCENNDFIQRVAVLHWPGGPAEFAIRRWAMIGRRREPEHCAAIAHLYLADEDVQRRALMSRHGFGRGKYNYFANPLWASIATRAKATGSGLVPQPHHHLADPLCAPAPALPAGRPRPRGSFFHAVRRHTTCARRSRPVRPALRVVDIRNTERLRKIDEPSARGQACDH